MSQQTDIELDGAGYMITPGSYRRSQDGLAEGRIGRVVVKDFFGGQRRALQLERDRGWDAEGVGPALFGQGVEPWPYRESYTDSTLSTVTTIRSPHLVVGDHVYIAVGQYLYRSISLSTATWSNFTQVYAAGSGKTITALARYQGKVALCFGNGLDIQIYDPGTNNTSTLSSGIKGRHAVGYANALVYSNPAVGQEVILQMFAGGVGSDQREFDAPIVNMGLHDGQVVIATRTSLWTLGGRFDPNTSTWTTEPQPFFTHGVWTHEEDFLFLLSYGGKLYTWLANQVMEWNPHGDRAGWRASGLEGRSCHGATVTGNMLVVCITNRAGQSETWAFDGSGWWLMLTSANQTRIWPAHLAGAGTFDLVTFRNGSSSVTYDLYRMIYRHDSAPNYASSGQYKTSLLDAGERDKMKAWRRIGATFTSPEIRGNSASTDPVTLDLSYSNDGGRTFTSAVTATFDDPTTTIIELDSSLSNAVAVSRSIMLRLSFTSVSDWSPVLTSLWAEYEILDAPTRRRKWSLKIHARDAAIQRDGSPATRTGRQLAADLWAAWQTGNTLSFRDLDFDVTGHIFQVRITGISEDIAKPSDGSRWGESLLALTLVEI